MPSAHILRRFILAAAAATCLAATSASAQTAAEIQATAARLNREVPCLRQQQERLNHTLRLLDEARQQASTTTAGQAAQRDAVHSAEALELRVGVIVGELRACLGQAGSRAAGAGQASTQTGSSAGTATGAGTTTGGTGGTAGAGDRRYPPRVVVRHADDGATAPARHPAEQSNPATQVIDQDRPLQPHVRVVRGERVDGLGQAEPSAVRAAVTNVSPRFEACYQQLVERGALQSGRVYLTFSVTPQGRIRDIRLENFTIYERTFQRCIGAAAGRLHVGEPAVGGYARYSFHLRFGPQQ